MHWKKKLENVPVIPDLEKLPNYGFIFFFKNIKGFRLEFVLLTFSTMISAVLTFSNVYILSRVVSNDITTLDTDKIFKFYLPLYCGIVLLSETLDYFLRRYAEAIPAVYKEYTYARFYKTILNSNFTDLFNYSKEKLSGLIDKYLVGIEYFLTGWFWVTARRVTTLVIILIILGVQSPSVLAFNIVYFSIFGVFALRLSSQFSKYASAYSRQTINTIAVNQSFVMNLNSVKRLGVKDFLVSTMSKYIGFNWDELNKVRIFHSRRWFIQLILSQAVYIATLFNAIGQIRLGALPLGYILLVQYAFSNINGIFVYFIEYYVNMVQQKEDAKIIRTELGKILSEENKEKIYKFKPDWKKVELKNIECVLENQSSAPIVVTIPEFYIQNREKVGVVGESGSGKSTLFNIMLNLVEYKGEYMMDGNNVCGRYFSNNDITVINNSDALFNISVRDNLCLGDDIPDEEVKRVLKNVCAEEFTSNLDAVVGAKNTSFSAGQLQRIRIARGLLRESKLYLLDEPFNGIDADNKEKIMKYLLDYLKDAAFIFVTHNKEELRMIDRMYRFDNHTLVQD